MSEIDKETGRFSCTKENPMLENHSGRWIHRDAKILPKNDPYWNYYSCPNCKLEFKVEVAE